MQISSKFLIICLVFIVLLSICIFSNSFIYGSSYADNYNPGAPWELQWSDEFNGTNLDLSKWQYEVKADFGTGELEYCTDRPQNVFISNGILNIQAQRENYSGKSFTSGRIKTQGRFAPRYGKIAAKMKLPYGYGMWPAFWMLGNNFPTKGWPKCGELDIMEMCGGNGATGDNTVVSSFHWYVTSPSYTGQGDSGSSYTFSQRLADDWHVYEMNWTPTTITFLFDGVQVHSMNIGDPSGSNCFNFPFFIILNLAVGGNFWNPAITNPSQVTASFPQSLQVDWVRVYNDSSLNLPASPSATQNLAVYTETHTGVDATARGAQLFIWENTCTRTTVAPGTGGEGSECMQLTINGGWMGLGWAGPALGDNLTNYRNSYLCFKIKTTATCGFHVGIECGGIAKNVLLSSAYGYANDGQWHNIRIPMADLAGLDFNMVTHYFMLWNDQGTTAGDVVYLDDIYWTTNSDTYMIPVVSGGQEIVINSETHTGYNVLTNGANLDPWEGTVTIVNDASAAHEGSTGWKVTVVNGGWFGWGVSTKARDLSAFTNSTIKFDIKSTASSQIRVSMQSANMNDCYYNLSKFGYVNDGQWHTISIPCNQCYGIDFSQVQQYLMFLFDGAVTAGDVFYIDNVYYTAGSGPTTPVPTPTSPSATATPTPTSPPATATPTSIPGGTVIFSDGFESNNFTASGWTNSGCTITTSYKYAGAYSANFNSSDSLTKAFSTVGYTNIQVQYARYTRNCETNDYFIAEWYNGSAWTTMESQAGNSNWAVNTWDLPAGAANNANFQIRFRTSHNGSSDYAYLDEVKILGAGVGPTATPTPTFGPTITPTLTPAPTVTPIPTPGGGEVIAIISSATASTAVQPAGYSCDGNSAGTRWESASSDPQWIYWDFGSNKNLSKIVIDWEVASAANYTIQGSTNASNWTTLATVTNSSHTNHNIITTTISGLYRYIRMYGTARTTGYAYSIWETTIYVWNGATPTPTTAPTATPSPTPAPTVTPTSGPTATPTPGESEAIATILSTAASTAVKSAGYSCDGNSAGTRWESATSDPQWIYWDLGNNKSLSKIVIDWEVASAANYTIQGSTDASNWTTLATETNSSHTNHNIITTTINGSYRYVRMYGTSRTTSYAYSIWETYIYILQ